jgi:hypothetical protein
VPVNTSRGASPPRRWVIVNLASVYVVFGSTYLAIRIMVESIPPLIGAGLRFLVAGAVLVLGWSLVHRRFPRVTASNAIGVTVAWCSRRR